MKTIGLYGGTFNPVHFGHLLLAESCREQIPLDEVWWVPAAVSPFKQGEKPAEANHRLEMLRLATAGNPAFRIEPIELERGGVSYTVETLRALSERHADCRWYLLLGADSFASFSKWHKPEEIVHLARLAVVCRPGAARVDARALRDMLPQFAKEAAGKEATELMTVEMPLIGLSSTELRARVAAGRTIRYQTPRAVEEYIRQHQLYENDS